MIDNIYDLEIYKRCSRGIECCNPNGIDGWLLKNEFWKEKRNKDKLDRYCKNCRNYYRTRHRTSQNRQVKGKGQYRNPFHVLSRRTSDSNSNSKKTRNKNTTKMGYGRYKSPFDVISERNHFINKRAKKYNMPKLTTHQTAALLIAQNYKCVITGIDLFDDFVRMSPDHIEPFVDSNDTDTTGTNDISNIIWMHSSINQGKNGDTIDYIIDVTLKVGYPNDNDKYKREQRKDEIRVSINKAHVLYPKVYEKIKDLSTYKLSLLFNSKINAIDLLNT